MSGASQSVLRRSAGLATNEAKRILRTSVLVVTAVRNAIPPQDGRSLYFCPVFLPYRKLNYGVPSVIVCGGRDRGIEPVTPTMSTRTLKSHQNPVSVNQNLRGVFCPGRCRWMPVYQDGLERSWKGFQLCETVNVMPCNVRRYPQPIIAVSPSECAWSAARVRGIDLFRAASPSERARRSALTAAIQAELAMPLVTPRSERRPGKI
jgi:hypothetical protein